MEIIGHENIVGLFSGTDGIDGPTDAAGAICDGNTRLLARQYNCSARDHLVDNDSYTFFEKMDDLIKTAFKEIEKLKQNGAEAKELNKVKEIYTRERESKLKENSTWLQELHFYHVNGENLKNIVSFDKHIDKLSSNDIQKAASQYFNMENYVQVILRPEQTPER